MSTSDIAVSPDQLAIIRAILARYLPENAQVWAYGSRARSVRVHRGSDLDLAIDAGSPLSLSIEGMMDEEFSESLLPFEVDIVDVHYMSPAFRFSVQKDFRPIAFARLEAERQQFSL